MSTLDLIARASAQYDLLFDESQPDAVRAHAADAHGRNLDELDRRASKGDAEAYDYLAGND